MQGASRAKEQLRQRVAQSQAEGSSIGCKVSQDRAVSLHVMKTAVREALRNWPASTPYSFIPVILASRPNTTAYTASSPLTRCLVCCLQASSDLSPV